MQQDRQCTYKRNIQARSSNHCCRGKVISDICSKFVCRPSYPTRKAHAPYYIVIWGHNTYIHTYIHIYIHTYIHRYIRTYVHTNICTHIHTQYVYFTRTCVCVCVHARVLTVQDSNQPATNTSYTTPRQSSK
jgi:hypothetical protein